MSEVSAVQHTVTPHLIVKGGADAIAFYEKAFGAKTICRMDGPDGRIMHAAIEIGDSKIMLADECPSYGCLSPLGVGGTAVVLHLHVQDVDGLFAQAVEAGATVKMPLMNMFWGDRYGKVTDPFGHEWALAQTIETLTYDEMAERGRAFMAEMAERELAAV